MNKENKCVSLETARKLKYAGFPQDTERYWETSFSSGWLRLSDDVAQGYYLIRQPGLSTTGDCKPTFAAPDAQEIGEELPFRNKRMGTVNDARLRCEKLPANYIDGERNIWCLFYVDEDNDTHVTPNFIASEAEARASMWLYLKENKLI